MNLPGMPGMGGAGGGGQDLSEQQMQEQKVVKYVRSHNRFATWIPTNGLLRYKPAWNLAPRRPSWLASPGLLWEACSASSCRVYDFLLSIHRSLSNQPLPDALRHSSLRASEHYQSSQSREYSRYNDAPSPSTTPPRPSRHGENIVFFGQELWYDRSHLLGD